MPTPLAVPVTPTRLWGAAAAMRSPAVAPPSAVATRAFTSTSTRRILERSIPRPLSRRDLPSHVLHLVLITRGYAREQRAPPPERLQQSHKARIARADIQPHHYRFAGLGGSYPLRAVRPYLA